MDEESGDKMRLLVKKRHDNRTSLTWDLKTKESVHKNLHVKQKNAVVTTYEST